MSEKKKILLVDDDKIIHMLAQDMLKDEYETTFCLSGKEALNILYRKLTPDLILLDILMPDMDGWEIFKRIKTISFLMNTPIVFITSLEDEKSRKHAQELGARDFIRKPFIKDELLKRIDAILNRNTQ